MTANAFDDDIEKSKTAGMNAHLTKPIEPERLFSGPAQLYHGQGRGINMPGSSLAVPGILCIVRREIPFRHVK